MQKIVLIFVLLAVVALAVANENPEKHDMPKASIGVVHHRVARQVPMKMPSMDEIMAMGQDMMSKLPPQMQEYANKAQEMAKSMMPGK